MKVIHIVDHPTFGTDIALIIQKDLMHYSGFVVIAVVAFDEPFLKTSDAVTVMMILVLVMLLTALLWDHDFLWPLTNYSYVVA